MPILIPGVGAQGGALREVVAAHREAGSDAYLISASRSILYAFEEGAPLAEAAAYEAAALDKAIRDA
jgi:orotidine-5'-phosphate decarboxylase